MKKNQKAPSLVSMTIGWDQNRGHGAPQSSSSNMKLGEEEREMILTITGPQDPLDYPLHPLQMLDGQVTQEYEIPQEDRENVFKKLYLFDIVPSMDTVMLDIHEGRRFVVKDFRVIRENGGNILVSPFYQLSGGTVLDWINDSEENQGDIITQTRVIAKEHQEED